MKTIFHDQVHGARDPRPQTADSPALNCLSATALLGPVAAGARRLIYPYGEPPRVNPSLVGERFFSRLNVYVFLWPGTVTLRVRTFSVPVLAFSAAWVPILLTIYNYEKMSQFYRKLYL